MKNDWKLRLKHGKMKTAFKHYTLIANGRVVEQKDQFDNHIGDAYMAMKAWASSKEESVKVIKSISEQVGFILTGDIQIFKTDPSEPPQDEPFGYGIQFTPMLRKKKQPC